MQRDETVNDILTDLELKGSLMKLVNSGVCSPFVLRNMEVYRFIDSRVRTGTKKTAAVKEAEGHFKICANAIFVILRGYSK